MENDKALVAWGKAIASDNAAHGVGPFTAETIGQMAARIEALGAENARLREGLKPFAAFCEQAERFVEARAIDGRTAMFPTKHFRLSDFRRARALTQEQT